MKTSKFEILQIQDFLKNFFVNFKVLEQLAQAATCRVRRQASPFRQPNPAKPMHGTGQAMGGGTGRRASALAQNPVQCDHGELLGKAAIFLTETFKGTGL